jgi:hypothetical protein
MTHAEAVTRLDTAVDYYARIGNGKPPRRVIIRRVYPPARGSGAWVEREDGTCFLANLRQLQYLPIATRSKASR